MARKLIIDYFGLTRTFAIASFVAIAIISTLSGYLFFWYLSDNMLRREIDISADFIHNVVDFDALMNAGKGQGMTEEMMRYFDESIAALADVINIRIYDRNSRIIWSSHRGLIGQIGDDDQDLQKALEGEKVYVLEEVGSSRPEHDYLPDDIREFVELYIPLWDEAGNIVGVVEMYKYPRALFESLEMGKRLVFFASLGEGLLLFLFLFWIVNNASKLIASQQTSLWKAREQAITRNEHFLSRIGAELHDGPAQAIGFALLRLEAVLGQLWGGGGGQEGEGKRIEKALRDALQDIRNISAGLAIPELSKLTPVESIYLAVDRHRRRTLMPVETRIAELPDDLGIAVKMCIYRVTQEGLNNAFRHAPDAEVTVIAMNPRSEIVIIVKDDGPGFPVSDVGISENDTQLGLAGLRERVESLGGWLHIRSQPGQGVELAAHIPYPQ